MTRMHVQELDKLVSIQAQLECEENGVVLINLFTVDPKDIEKFLAAWSADAAIMKKQSGFISTQLHRGIGGSSTFINYAVWESTSAFKAAFTNPEFLNSLGNYPSTAVASPHLFKRMAVKGICVE